jgi:hypothetical protein
MSKKELGNTPLKELSSDQPNAGFGTDSLNVS